MFSVLDYRVGPGVQHRGLEVRPQEFRVLDYRGPQVFRVVDYR